ncbi:12676_t:CDS:1, partial [Ambispora leptoticha]
NSFWNALVAELPSLLLRRASSNTSEKPKDHGLALLAYLEMYCKAA